MPLPSSEQKWNCFMSCHAPLATTRLSKFSSSFNDRELSLFQWNNVNFILLFLLRKKQAFIVKHAKFVKSCPLHTHNDQVKIKLTTAKLYQLLLLCLHIPGLSKSFMLFSPLYIHEAFILTMFTLSLIVEYIFVK